MAPEERGKLWGGRFREPTHPSVERFSASIGFDRALARYDIRGSLAHARMLAARGSSPRRTPQAIVRGLEEIAKEIDDGSFPFDDDARRHPHERRGAAERADRRRRPAACTPRAAATTRSRPTCGSISRDAARAARHGIALLRRGPDRARPASTSRRCCPATPTCSARSRCGSPTTCSRYERDARPRRRALRRPRADGSREAPLGSGALAGTTLPIDREATAAALGFARPESATASTRSPSATLRSSSSPPARICMVHLSRLAEELVLWSSAEFGFVELADAYSTGLEPDAAEEEPRRGRAGARQDRARDRGPGRAAHRR